MKAIQVTGPKLMSLVDVPAPSPEDGQVLLRVEHLSICGSDMRQFRHVHPEEAYPLMPGQPCHEIVGVVEESRAPGIEPGQRAIALPIRGYSGGSEFMVTAQNRVIPLPPDADPATYIMCQPVGTVLFAVKRLGGLLGKRVVVMGQGAIGLSFTDIISRMGAQDVIAVDYFDYRLAKAKTRGATVTLNAGRDHVAQAVADLTGGEGADAVVEASGTPESINILADLVRPYGSILLFGLPESDLVEVDYLKLMRRMATVIPTISASSEDPSASIREAVSLVSQGRLDVEWLVSHRLPFTDAPRAYQMYADYEDQVIKAVMRV